MLSHVVYTRHTWQNVCDWDAEGIVMTTHGSSRKHPIELYNLFLWRIERSVYTME
jgi:hypothetical protein